jgi:hypothetical protein
MTPEPAPTSPPALSTIDEQSGPPEMSEAGRLAGVFFSPGKAFADIARRPRWWVPVLLIAILGTVYINAFTQRVGWESVIRQALERTPNGQNMTAEQRQQAITVGARIYKYFGYGGSAVGTLFYIFIVAVIMLFLFDTLMSAGVGLKRMMAIVAYSCLPMLIQTALSMVVLFLKDPEEFNLQNPLMFNVGAFLSPETPAALRAAGSSIDFFSIWIMILIAIGVSTAARKISVGKALAGIMVPWLLFVILKSMAAAAGLYSA